MHHFEHTREIYLGFRLLFFTFNNNLHKILTLAFVSLLYNRLDVTETAFLYIVKVKDYISSVDSMSCVC